MAVSGDLRVSAIFGLYHRKPLRIPVPSSQVDLSCSWNGTYNLRGASFKWPSIATGRLFKHGDCQRVSGAIRDQKLTPKSISQEAEGFLLDVINMNFLERLNLVWKILFPSKASRINSNAQIAKQRLKMILFSDRCAVSDEAKRMIVSNIVRALSDFVVIESQDKVQLSMSTDSALGTIYSITVPVRRVKPEYQEVDESGTIINMGYKDSGEQSGSVDVRFDFYIGDEMAQ